MILLYMDGIAKPMAYFWDVPWLALSGSASFIYCCDEGESVM